MIEMVKLCLVPLPPVGGDLVAQAVLHDGNLAHAGESRLGPKALLETGDFPREQLDE